MKDTSGLTPAKVTRKKSKKSAYLSVRKLLLNGGVGGRVFKHIARRRMYVAMSHKVLTEHELGLDA